MPGLFWVVPAAGVVTIIFAIALARSVLSKPTGTPKMKEIGDIIFQGAWACWLPCLAALRSKA
jgi:K(+)-stimulated pyrophosphate-energized sodium pump